MKGWLFAGESALLASCKSHAESLLCVASSQDGHTVAMGGKASAHADAVCTAFVVASILVSACTQFKAAALSQVSWTLQMTMFSSHVGNRRACCMQVVLAEPDLRCT